MHRAKDAVTLAAAAIAACVCTAVAASPIRTDSGSYNGLHWQARSTIVGQTSTATAAGGGDPRYNAPMPAYSGVAALIMNFQNGTFICSGTLLPDRRSILTAAHCVTGGTLLSTQAFFYSGANPDTLVPFNPLSTAVNVSNVFVHPLYTQQVIDHNDIAVLRLESAAPDFARAHDLYTAGDLTGQGFNVAGYGGRSDTGGAVGANLATGRLRQGDNRFDYRMGDADFAGNWATIIGQPLSEIGFSFLSDFDNGLAANDTSCLVAADPFFGLAGAKFCDVGVGADEVSTAGGDSGGPEFIGDLIAAVTSYGLTFGTRYGDFLGGLNSSWGEFNGFVPVWIHEEFIRRNMVAVVVPEPGTLALLGLSLGLAGLAASRRRRA